MSTNMYLYGFSDTGKSLNIAFLEERWFTWFEVDNLMGRAKFIFPLQLDEIIDGKWNFLSNSQSLTLPKIV